jgi:beta-glucosidase
MKRATMSKRLAAGIIFLLGAHLGMAQVALAKPEAEKRVEAILGKMTLDENIKIIGGINDFHTRPIPRLGIPSLRMSDGPMGVHDYDLTTAYPAGIALAAS